MGYDLAPSGNPLPEPMLANIYVTIWYHIATMSIELTEARWHIYGSVNWLVTGLGDGLLEPNDQVIDLVVHYGISNTTVLEIP